MLLAFSTASSGVRNVMTASTGPKISSRAMRCDWATPVKNVGGNQKPLAGIAQEDWWSSAPSSTPEATSSRIFVELHLRVDRADVGVLVERIAQAQRRDPVGELAAHDGLGHRLLDEQARARAADVALVEIDAVDDAFDRLVDRRVLEDDVGGLAAELERQALAGAGRRALDELADLGRAREGDLRDARMVDEVRARLAGARHDVDDAGRQIRLLADLGRDASAVSGVVSAGFRTTVLPQASAGAIFQAAISSGKFHGMIWPQTPIGDDAAAAERRTRACRPSPRGRRNARRRAGRRRRATP